MSALIEPFTVCFLLTLAGWFHLWYRTRQDRGRLLPASLAFAGLTVICLPAASFLALGSLEWGLPRDGRMPTGEEAIVVLAGGFTPPDGIRTVPELDQATLYRCLHGIELYRRGGRRPIIVSGGKVAADDPGPPCAQVMRDFLVRSGVDNADIIVEGDSRSTFENASRCARILQSRRISQVVLVTSASHMKRAWSAFRKQGIEAYPSPCQFRATRFDWSLGDFLPSPNAARAFHQAFHEWLGVTWYWLRGRI